MEFKVKFRKHGGKTIPKTMLFSSSLFYRFWEGLGRVWGRFWEGVGGFLAPLGKLFSVIFGCLDLECALEGLLETSGLVSGGVREDFGRGLGGFWVGFGSLSGGILRDSG